MKKVYIAIAVMVVFVLGVAYVLTPTSYFQGQGESRFDEYVYGVTCVHHVKYSHEPFVCESTDSVLRSFRYR